MSSKTTPTATKKAATPALTPKLRFPEFRGAEGWESKALGNVCEILNNRRRPITSDLRVAGAYPYYGASGIVDFVGDFIFEERLLLVGEDGAKWEAFQKTAFIAEGKYWVNNHAHVLKPIDASDTFLENYLTMADIGPFVTGAAPPKLTLGKLKGIPVPIPPTLAEQQKIAECLSSVDELIAAQTRKVEALKTHKKGLMQQLFPREGETQPRLRFPEFQDAEEWEKTPLVEVLSPVLREQKKPSGIYTGLGLRSHGKGTFLKILTDPGKNSMEYLYEVKRDDLVINITFAWEGALAIAQASDDGALVSHRFPTYTFEKGKATPAFFRHIILDKLFIYQLGVISPGGAGRNRVLNKNDFLKLTVLLPALPEQQRIADCLSSLDDLITAHTQKLEALKTHKKGLMQQLFPAPTEQPHTSEGQRPGLFPSPEEEVA